MFHVFHKVKPIYNYTHLQSVYTIEEALQLVEDNKQTEAKLLPRLSKYSITSFSDVFIGDLVVGDTVIKDNGELQTIGKNEIAHNNLIVETWGDTQNIRTHKLFKITKVNLKQN